MERRKKKLIVLSLVRNAEGNFLLIQRHDPKVRDAHLRWDIPGGTHKFGESLEETLHRELAEETSISAQIVRMLPWTVPYMWEHEKYKMHVIVTCFLCEHTDGIPKTGDEGVAELAWVPLASLHEYDFLPTTKFFVEKVLAGDITFQ